MKPAVKAYTYRVRWSPAKHGYIATVVEFPALVSLPQDGPRQAIEALQAMVGEELLRLEAQALPVPAALVGRIVSSPALRHL